LNKTSKDIVDFVIRMMWVRKCRQKLLECYLMLLY